jgi:hypothetical protein
MGQRAKDMAMNSKCGISFGIDWPNANKEVRNINGVAVSCIIDSDLFEVSMLTFPGAVREAFAVYKDVDFDQRLRDECGYAKLVYDRAADDFTQALKNLLN